MIQDDKGNLYAQTSVPFGLLFRRKWLEVTFMLVEGIWTT